MKIALVYDALYPYVKGGGERRYYELARRLAEHHQVTFVSFGWWNGQPPALRHPNISYVSVGRPIPLYTGAGKRSIAEALRFGAAVVPALLQHRFDVVDCSAFPYFSVLGARSVTLLKRIPMVVTWYEYWGPYWFDYLGRKGILGRLIEDATLAASRRIISISPFTASRMERNLFCRLPAQVTIVPSGIDFTEIASAARQAEESDVIYVGRLLEHKRVDMLIRAVRALATRGTLVRCVIVGDGPERPRLERLSDDLGLAGAVRFKGFIPTSSVLGLMKASRAFVSPSTREGFGMAVLEANACGLPAVVVRAPGNASTDLIREGVTGYTGDASAEGLADAIEEALSRSSGATAEACTEYARRFDWSNIAAVTSQAYEAAVHGWPAPAGYVR